MRGESRVQGRPAPSVGQDNEQILQSLGYGADALTELRGKGAL
jgi:crotonobetainyl-CoA:carnitine CoA-transferase CaiB-like acyl-CoA transferase